MRPMAVRLLGMLGVLLLAALAQMAAFAPFSVDIRERGDPVWLVLLKLGIGTIAMCAIMIVLIRVAKRRFKKDATEVQLTAAALALTAVFLGSWVLSFRFAFGT
jgi:3-hydroxymyristoyl/3-hydroxydecanoyl-(acyl carrier protein) dehydratase